MGGKGCIVHVCSTPPTQPCLQDGNFPFKISNCNLTLLLVDTQIEVGRSETAPGNMSAREPTTNSQLTILAPHQIRAFTTNTDKPYLDKIDLYQMRVNHYVETSVVKECFYQLLLRLSVAEIVGRSRWEERLKKPKSVTAAREGGLNSRVGSQGQALPAIENGWKTQHQ